MFGELERVRYITLQLEYIYITLQLLLLLEYNITITSFAPLEEGMNFSRPNWEHPQVYSNTDTIINIHDEWWDHIAHKQCCMYTLRCHCEIHTCVSAITSTMICMIKVGEFAYTYYTMHVRNGQQCYFMLAAYIHSVLVDGALLFQNISSVASSERRGPRSVAGCGLLEHSSPPVLVRDRPRASCGCTTPRSALPDCKYHMPREDHKSERERMCLAMCLHVTMCTKLVQIDAYTFLHLRWLDQVC